MSVLVVCPGRNGSDRARIGRCRWTRTLVHELSEAVIVPDEVIEPLLDLLGIPEKSFALCEGFILCFHAIEEGFEPSESQLEREFRGDRWWFLRGR